MYQLPTPWHGDRFISEVYLTQISGTSLRRSVGKKVFMIIVQLFVLADIVCNLCCDEVDQEAHWKAIALSDPLSVVLCYLATVPP